MRRPLMLAGVLLVVVAAATVGWLAGSRIKSPAQVAAETAPPEPSLITVPVERTTISNDVITRGTVRFEDPQTVAASGVILPETDPVVTMIPEVGDVIDEGGVLYELAGRPTFVLRGDLPLFRTAERGAAGEDIAQLQDALTRLGFYEGEIDGEYGASTESALVDFYEDRGYEAWRPRFQSRYPLAQTEFVFFEDLPIRVDTVLAERGDVASGDLLQVSGSRLAIDASVSIEEADLISVGDPVQIDASLFDLSVTGVVSDKASTPGTNGVAADEVYLEIVPDEVVAELNNTNVRITIPVAARSTEGSVLAVPAAALSATGSGDTIVTVVDDGGSTRAVVVVTGLATAAGLVEVTPAAGGALVEGDWVVVGTQRAVTTTTAP